MITREELFYILDVYPEVPSQEVAEVHWKNSCLCEDDQVFWEHRSKIINRLIQEKSHEKET